MKKSYTKPFFITRDKKVQDGTHYREFTLSMTDGKPSSIDEATRSVEMVCATENPVVEYDYDHGYVPTVLLMSGCEMPASKQVPLQDTHDRWSTATTIGSFREMRVEGNQLIGRAYFADVPSVEETWIKVRDGHLTDCSVGCLCTESVWVPKDTKTTISGREFIGPAKVVTRWRIFENSVCPIGADQDAKARAAGLGKNEQQKPAAQNHEGNSMDPVLRAFLERLGLKKDASDAEAEVFLARVQAQEIKVVEEKKEEASAPQASERSAHDILAEERTRTFEIQAMCRQFGMPELAETMVRDGVTIDAARAKVMDNLAKNTTEGNGGFGYRTAEVGMDDREKFRDAATHAISLRGGMAVEKPAAGAEELAGRSMVELSRMLLNRAGHSDSGRGLDVVGRALTTTDLPVILGATANLSLQEGWNEQEESWTQFCATGSVNDFKKNKAARATRLDDLEELPEGEEYKYGKMGEHFEEYAIATYGKMFAITRQALVNDDLGALTDVPKHHGMMAKRKVGDIVWAVLVANSNMGDGKALFHNGHNNILSAGAISTATLGAGIKAMKGQKIGQQRLNIRPQFLLAPTALESSAESFFATETFHHIDGGDTLKNIYAGNYFTRIYEGRLDDDSETAWYLAGPKGKTIKVFFLDGVQLPYLEMRNGWSVDGVEHKVRIDAGAKAMAWEALAKNAGA